MVAVEVDVRGHVICDCVHHIAAECAQQLVRNVNYEISALKQQISKCQQTQRVIQTDRQTHTCSSLALSGHVRIARGKRENAMQVQLG